MSLPLLFSLMSVPHSVVAAGMGWPVTSTGKALTVSCPVCGSGRLHGSVHGSWLCDNTYCGWLAGNHMSLIQTTAGGTGEEVLSWLRQLSPAHFTAFPDLRGAAGSGVVSTHARQKDLLALLLQLAGPGRHDADCLWIDAWLTNHGMDPSTCALTALRMSRSSLRQLEEGLADLYPSSTRGALQSASGSCFVVPYGPCPGCITALAVMNPKTSWSHVIWLEQCPVQYSGLLQHMPGASTCVLSGSFLTASIMSHLPACGGMSFLSPLLRPQVTSTPVPPDASRVVYAMSPDEDMTTGSMLRRLLPRVEFTTHDKVLAGQPDHVPWCDIVHNRLMTMLDNNGDLRLPGVDVLRAACLTEEEQADLSARFTHAGKSRAARTIDACGNEAAVLQSGRHILHKTASGYELTGGDVPEAVTNFTALPTESVLFAQKQDLCHKLRVRFGRHRFDILMPRLKLDMAAEVEKAVQMAAMRAGVRDSLPMILSPRNGFKYVLRHWKEHLAGTPVLPGISSLGWTPDRKAFATPAWMAGMDGTTSARHAYHPDVLLFDHYRVADEQDLKPPGIDDPVQAWNNLPAGLQQLTLWVAGFMARAHANKPCRVLPIKQTSTVQTALEEGMRALWQMRGVTALQVLQGSTSGYPVYGYSSSSTLAGQIDGCGLVLCPQGAYCPLPESDVTHASMWGSFLRWLLWSLPDCLMEGGLRLDEHRSVLVASQVQHDGVQTLTRFLNTDIHAPPVPFKRVEEFFADKEARALSGVMRYDPDGNRVRWDMPARGNHDLEMEVRMLCREVERRDSCLHVDAESIFGAMRQFYGSLPVLELV